ncbi:hypothetical protein ACNKXS_03315 [Christiangramia marina]|uniref:hypothetical protein n=1 Tax=Christiangramia marina TaxID=409436 RepID=UPI003AA9B08F
MRKYKNNPTPPMLNRAILELNGVFNVPSNSQQRSGNGENEIPLQRDLEEKKYVHPIIIPADISRTRENYLKAKDTYNKRVAQENYNIKKYNKQVEKSRCNKPLQPSEIKALSIFYKMISPLNTWERNERVQEYNRCNGSLIAKKDKIQTLKYPTQLVFEAIVWHYSMQLYERKSNRLKLQIDVPATLPPVNLHSGWMTSEKIHEERRLDICKRTLRRQRKRLQEANILQEYEFSGSAKPVKIKINPKILCITDNHLQKKTAAGNQSVNPDGRTKLPHNNVSNRSFLLNKEIKANVSKHSRERSSAQGLTPNDFSSIGNTRKQVVKKNDTPPEKNSSAAKKNTLSEFLRRKLEEKTDFAANLAAHQYDSYEPLRKDILKKEALSGSMDREEFKELILQDFFKSSAKLYRNETPYLASWLKAYNHWIEKKFINPSGYSLKKIHLVEKIDELRYGLAAVGRFMRKNPEYNLLYPGDYFDLTRTTAKEGGFKYYAGEAWRKHQSYLKNKTDDTNNKAIKRKRKISDLQKAQRHVKSYLDNKIQFDELFVKVKQIGNKSVYQDLPEIIKKANVKHQLKYSRHEL